MSSNRRSLLRFWRELVRRRVPHVAATYVVVSLAAIEAVPMVLEGLGALSTTSGWAQSFVTIVSIAGFPLALTLAWLFQVVRDSPEDPPAHPWRSLKRLPAAVVLVVVGASCVALMGGLWPPYIPSEEAVRPVEMRLNRLALLPPVMQLGEAEALRPAECVVNRLIDRLNRRRAFDVTPPEAVRRFKGSTLPPDSVALQLGVGVVVASSVEQHRDSLILNLRVIDGLTGDLLRTVQVGAAYPDPLNSYEALTHDAEQKLRRALGEVRGVWAEEDVHQDPVAQSLMELAEQELAAYQRRLGQGNVAGALRALDEADSLLTRASRAAPRWPQPLVQRGLVDHRRARLQLTQDRPGAVASMERAYRAAELALRMESGNPEALFLRGLSAFRRAGWDTAVATPRVRLLERAEEDLRWSQSRHPSRGEVRYWLARVKKEQGLLEEAYDRAVDAHEHDSFLEVTSQVLVELSDLSFELGREEEAVRWCQEGAARYPSHLAFQLCRLRLMGWGLTSADTTEANVITRDALAGYPAQFQGVIRPQLEVMRAAVYAQAGATAKATDLLQLATLDSTPAVHVTAAGVWLLLGRTDEALEQVRAYVGRVPSQAHRLSTRRVLDGLWDSPEFQRLISDDPG